MPTPTAYYPPCLTAGPNTAKAASAENCARLPGCLATPSTRFKTAIEDMIEPLQDAVFTAHADSPSRDSGRSARSHRPKVSKPRYPSQGIQAKVSKLPTKSRARVAAEREKSWRTCQFTVLQFCSVCCSLGGARDSVLVELLLRTRLQAGRSGIDCIAEADCVLSNAC
jgi:hypothetical protein